VAAREGTGASTGTAFGVRGCIAEEQTASRPRARRRRTIRIVDERLARWNERYRTRSHTHDLVPSPPLPEVLRDHAPAPGRALDLACGAGRHALYLAEHGWRVVAVDAAEEGVAILRAEARRRGLDGRIESHVADLLSDPPEFTLEPAGYDLVCDMCFLARSLFDEMRAAVRPGGLLVAAIHVADEPGDRRLRRGELRQIVAGWGWEILIADEGESPETGHRHDTAWIAARRPPTAS